MLAPWKKSYEQPWQHIKKQRHYFADKGPSSQIYGFPSGHMWMWELDHKEGWVLNNWCFQTVVDFIFLGSKITADGDYSHETKRRLLLGRKVMTNLDLTLKSRDVNFANKGLSSQGYDFSSSHVWMWHLDYKESWVQKNWCFWSVVLEKTLESPWTARRSNSPS